ncbi:MAG: hypothetical protein ACR2IE_00070 [Candidatus Sumerlaeaceae bacterium]
MNGLLRLAQSTTAAVSLVLFGCTTEPAPPARSDSRGGGTSDVVVAPAGGDKSVDTSAVRSGGGFGGRYDPRGKGPESSRGNTAEGAAFADYVIATDPEHKFVKDAFVRDDQMLGVIVSPTMSRGQVDQALGSLLRGMQERFQKYPLQVIAYYESGDEMARSVYDGRNTNTEWKN